MSEVRSADGTRIAFDKTGRGPAIILVDGALCSRAMGPMVKLAPQLAGRFTVFTYDRRGRGGSGDTEPYAVKREVEDIAALIGEAGGTACLFGVSSGAALALEAAKTLTGIPKLAIYEAPFVVDGSRDPVPADVAETMRGMVADGRRGDAVRLFLSLVGMPKIMLSLMRLTPVWKKLKAVAHTLPYDMTILKGRQQGRPLPAGEFTAVTVPALVIAGGKSPAWMRDAMAAVHAGLPNSELRVLPGQTHMVKAKVVAPVLVDFFGDGAARAGERPAAATAA